MKIAIVSQSYPPMLSGAALFAERLAVHFSTNAHEVLVLAASDQTNPYQVQQSNLRTVRFRSYHNPLRAGQRFALWPHRQIIQCLSEFSPDLIHIHEPFQMAVSCLAYGRSRRVPVIITIHQLPGFLNAYLPGGKPVQRVVEFLLWRYARWILNRCTRAVVATRTIADVIEYHIGFCPEVISCGVDLSIYSPETLNPAQEMGLCHNMGIPDQTPIILHVGRLDKEKQVARVIQAAALAMRQTPAHLLIVGDGTEKLLLAKLCTSLGIGERSHFPGFVPVENGLPALFRASTVFITASEIETQGLVLLEAAASGLPIVAVQATCLHEIVHEGKNGFLLPSGDLTGMADRLYQLIQDPKQAFEMGQSGRQIVENHAVSNTFAAYENVYRAACQEACSAASTKVTSQIKEGG